MFCKQCIYYEAPLSPGGWAHLILTQLQEEALVSREGA